MHKSNTETFTYDIGLATLWLSVFVWVWMSVCVSRDFISQASTKSVKVPRSKRNRRSSYFVILKHKCVYSVMSVYFLLSDAKVRSLFSLDEREDTAVCGGKKLSAQWIR